jgi:hypothetical protein
MTSNFKNDAKLLLEAKQNIITGRPAKAKATNKRAVLGQLRPVQFPENFAKFFRFPVTSNLWTYA